MREIMSLKNAVIAFIAAAAFYGAACQTETVTTNINTPNVNTNVSNTFAMNTNSVSAESVNGVPETKEPDEYQATVKLNFEAVGDQKKTVFPTLAAKVARKGMDRRMEFALPTGEKVIYLDKSGKNYLILPGRNQYAELDRESVGFEIRRMMMPEQIVKQVKNLQGMERAGEEKIGGRDVIKYRYRSEAETGTAAGKVETGSFLIVDKDTGLPLRSETVSESRSGNVQGYEGVRVVTEMTDISTTADPSLFDAPTGLQKIDTEQVKAQVNLVFNAVAAVLKSAVAAPSPAASPASSPAAAEAPRK